MQDTFKGNYRELRKLLVIAEDPKIVFEWIKKAKNNKATEEHTELLRLFHNYLMSVMSLVDHTRKLMRKTYEDTELKCNYDSQVNMLFFECPMCKFVQDLRNYITHYGLPQSVLYLSVSDTPKSSLILRVEKLKAWKKWNKLSKQFLNEQYEDISVLTLIDNHSQKILDHHAWLNYSLEEYHQNDLIEFKELRRKQLL